MNIKIEKTEKTTLKRKIRDNEEDKKLSKKIKTSNQIKTEIKEEPKNKTSHRVKSEINEEVKIKTEIKEEPKIKTSHRAKSEINEEVKLKTSLRVKTRPNEQLWDDYDLLSQTQNLSPKVSKVLIRLFEDGNTIPFIARYRKSETGNLNPEKLRDVKEEFDGICNLKARSQTVLKSLEKSGNLNRDLKTAVLSAVSLEELEHIYAPYKPGSQRTLAQRAKALGLEQPALAVMNGSTLINLRNYIDTRNKELINLAHVEKGFMYIIASVIATDTEVLAFVRTLRNGCNFSIETKKMITKKATQSKKNKTESRRVDESKFENYFDYRISSNFIKPHQILAINRGESLKVVSVKIVVPNYIWVQFKDFCSRKWKNTQHYNVLEMSIKDSYTRLVQPLIIREVRSELKLKAEKASYEVFSTNVKQLLMMPPLKGRPILGIDPGFANGCKLALISETGSVLCTNVIYPTKRNSKADEDILYNMLQKYNCNLIALGNATACRETETWLSSLLQKNIFTVLGVTYTIVNESGASIYSCSAEAKKEFPSMDPNLISAVSLARRVQEPLSELVKVEPKHLGVGMYQHDLPKKYVEQALDEVVMECVSFVGVDLNTASQCLLRRVAGLSDKRAQEIINYRDTIKSFQSRKQLMDVKGIGAKIFQQCAGFLRVGPVNSNQGREFYKNKATNILDSTHIHPESYDITLELLKNLSLNINEVGEANFIEAIKSRTPCLNLEEYCLKFNTSVETLNLILDALGKPLNFDLRSEISQKPLFKKGLTDIKYLKVGDSVTGCVNNVTHFGCFVDIGVGRDGLIHQSKLKGFILQIGDKVEVTVDNIELGRNRISLIMIKKL